MASNTTGYIGAVSIDNGSALNIGSTAYGVCTTAAGTAAKTVEMTGFVLTTGATIHVNFANGIEDNELPTLNVNNTGAKDIFVGDDHLVFSVDPGSVLSLTYDGTYWKTDYDYTATATTSKNGFMSFNDKSKLNGIEANANNYSLPIAASNLLGGIKVGRGLAIDSETGVLSVTGGGGGTTYTLGTSGNNITLTDDISGQAQSITAPYATTALRDNNGDQIDTTYAKAHNLYGQVYVTRDDPNDEEAQLRISTERSAGLYIRGNNNNEPGIGFSYNDYTDPESGRLSYKYDSARGNAFKFYTSITSNTFADIEAKDGYFTNISATGSISENGTALASKYSPISHTHNYAGSSSAGGAANSANVLNTNADIPSGANLNNYITDGPLRIYRCNANATAATLVNCPTTNAFVLFVACHAGTYQLLVTYPSSGPVLYHRNYYSSTWGAWKEIKTTDTTYSSQAAASGGTAVSLVTTGEKYTWNNKSNLTIGTTATTAAAGNHTHSYAGSSSAGGAATSANKLNTNAGAATTPVYFSNGVPVACTAYSSASVNYATSANAASYGVSSTYGTLGTSCIRNISASTTDLTPGTTGLTTGCIYLVYE